MSKICRLSLSRRNSELVRVITHQAVAVEVSDLSAFQSCSNGRELIFPDLVGGDDQLLHNVADRGPITTEELVLVREVML